MISRRDFLKASAVAGAGLVLNPYIRVARALQDGTSNAVLLSTDTYRSEWRKIADAFRERYKGELVGFREDPKEAFEQLKEQNPTHIVYVADPEELSIPSLSGNLNSEKTIVSQSNPGKFNNLLAALGDGELTSLGGIITGYDIEDGLRMVGTDKLHIRNGLFATAAQDLLPMTREGVGYSDGRETLVSADDYYSYQVVGNKEIFEKQLREKGHAVTVERMEKRSGRLNKKYLIWKIGEEVRSLLNSGKVDLIATSAHASYRDWQLGNGYVDYRITVDGRGGLQLLDRENNETPSGSIKSDNKKVWLALGNCQMGRIKTRDSSIALAAMNSLNAVVYIGYLSNTWYGRGGWGIMDNLWLSDENPTFAEAHRQTQIGLRYFVSKLQGIRERNGLGNGRDESGCRFDLGNVVFYGNPVADVRFDRDPNYVPSIAKSVKRSSTPDGRTRYRLSIECIRDFNNFRVPPVFQLSDLKSHTDVKADKGVDHSIGRRSVIMNVTHDFDVENGEPKIVHKALKKGQKWSMEFVA